MEYEAPFWLFGNYQLRVGSNSEPYLLEQLAKKKAALDVMLMQTGKKDPRDWTDDEKQEYIKKLLKTDLGIV